MNGTSAVVARTYGAASASVSSRQTSVFDRRRSITLRGAMTELRAYAMRRLIRLIKPCSTIEPS